MQAAGEDAQPSQRSHRKVLVCVQGQTVACVIITVSLGMDYYYLATDKRMLMRFARPLSLRAAKFCAKSVLRLSIAYHPSAGFHRRLIADFSEAVH